VGEHPREGLVLDGIDWRIAGGESGPPHRRVEPDWIRDLRDRCSREDVAFFFKRWATQPKARGRELDGREWDDLPAPRARTLALVG
jgi:protein gp37